MECDRQKSVFNTDVNSLTPEQREAVGDMLDTQGDMWEAENDEYRTRKQLEPTDGMTWGGVPGLADECDSSKER